MKFIVATIACLLLASTARADRDPEFEAGLTSVAVQGDQVLPGPTYTRSQLVTKDTTTAKTVGTAAALVGGLSLIGGWTVYAARQNYRLRVRGVLGSSVGSWETMGAWSLTLGGFGAANLVASEMLLLHGDKIPALAWVGGVIGVGVAAVALGFIVGGTGCAPLALQPGSSFPVDCMSPLADKLFGVELLLTAAPLITLPLSYVLRGLFEGRPDSLSLGPGSLQYKAVF